MYFTGVCIYDLDLSMRVWDCPNPICHVYLDRDLNAAQDIRDQALRLASA